MANEHDRPAVCCVGAVLTVRPSAAVIWPETGARSFVQLRAGLSGRDDWSVILPGHGRAAAEGARALAVSLLDAAAAILARAELGQLAAERAAVSQGRPVHLAGVVEVCAGCGGAIVQLHTGDWIRVDGGPVGCGAGEHGPAEGDRS